MTKFYSMVRSILPAVILAITGWSAGAATTNVVIKDFAFSPPSVSINVNDSVNWNWTGNSHTTTSSTGLWDSGVHNAGASFTHTFGTAGNFPYFCAVHTFMLGSVTVSSGSLPPAGTSPNPAPGAVLVIVTAGGRFPLDTVTDPSIKV